MTPGKFISFEGGEGGGKTTQLTRLAGFLRQRGIEFVETREPGGTPQGEELRRLLVQGDPGRWLPVSELLMMTAARAEHVHHVIAPALAAGKWVLCDRFIDSTLVYQGIAGNAGVEMAMALHQQACGGLLPDVTFVLDLPVEIGLARAEKRGGDARFEKKGAEYHERIRMGFKSLTALYHERMVQIDAQHSFDLVWSEVEKQIKARFGFNE